MLLTNAPSIDVLLNDGLNLLKVKGRDADRNAKYMHSHLSKLIFLFLFMNYSTTEQFKSVSVYRGSMAKAITFQSQYVD